jgi:hypothetical protein
MNIFSLEVTVEDFAFIDQFVVVYGDEVRAIYLKVCSCRNSRFLMKKLMDRRGRKRHLKRMLMHFSSDSSKCVD